MIGKTQVKGGPKKAGFTKLKKGDLLDYRNTMRENGGGGA